MDRTRTVEARTSDFLSVDRTRGKGGQCKKKGAAYLPRLFFVANWDSRHLGGVPNLS